jgi:hypothetical protein
VDATFFALTGFALPVLRRATPPEERGPAWIAVAAIVFSVLQMLAITGSLFARDVRVVALTGLAWIGVAALVWAIFFRTVGGPGGRSDPSQASRDTGSVSR